jgi:tetratricopeptide (TPR) repeat protein
MKGDSMDCNRSEKLLVEYVYQELSAKATLKLEKHLQLCDRCSKTLENWQAIHRGFQKSTGEALVPPYLKQRILVSAKEELQRKPTFGEMFVSFLRPAMVAPVIIFGLIALLVTWQKEARKTEMAEVKASVGTEQEASDLRLRKMPPAAPQQNATKTPSGEGSSLSKDLENDGKSDQPAREDFARQKTDKLEQGAVGGLQDQTLKRPESQNEAAKPAEREFYGNLPAKVSDEKKMAKLKESGAKKQEELASAAPAAAPPAPSVQDAEEAPQGDSEFQQAQYWFKNNQLNQGKIVAEQAISRDKNKSLATQFHQAGIDYQKSNEPQQAIVQYNLVLKNYPEYPDSPDVLLRLGDSYTQIGEYDKAISAYAHLQNFGEYRSVAAEKLKDVQARRKAQEQLKSLGYVSQKPQ